MSKVLISEVVTKTKIKRSVFETYLYPVPDVEQAKLLLSEHQKKYPGADHHCYAWVFGAEQETRHSSDAGEPAGSAGKPMLNALLSNDLTKVLAIVSRYFGGIKLGVKGLIEAYNSVVLEAIKQAGTEQFTARDCLQIRCDYNIYELLKGLQTQYDLCLNALAFESRVLLQIECPQEHCQELKKILAGFEAQKKLDFI